VRSLANLGAVAHARGERAAARSLLTQSIELGRGVAGQDSLAELLERQAIVAVAEAQPERALRLAGAGAALRATAGTALSADRHAALDGRLAAAREALHEESAAWAWTQGRAMTLEQALEYALAEEPVAEQVTMPAALSAAGTAAGTSTERVAPAARPAPAVPPEIAPATAKTPLDLLTARERQVAALVARGLTNRQIAEALIVTVGTAAIHVEHIRRKLGFRSRAQIASWAVEHGLLVPHVA
jgi:DNA-binding NarL/FixJ family response regulator